MTGAHQRGSVLVNESRRAGYSKGFERPVTGLFWHGDGHGDYLFGSAHAGISCNCQRFVLFEPLFLRSIMGRTVARFMLYRQAFLLDVIDHLRGPGFFTLPAGSSVLGSQFIMLTDFTLAGRVLWVLAILLWLALTYTIFTAFTVKEEKPSLDKGI